MSETRISFSVSCADFLRTRDKQRDLERVAIIGKWY